ncbi:MAG: hypothetical protein M0P57_13530, partial [Syntrophales bacterium]|nr:hypothetical protein [Syntrophales bacterium]
MPQFPFFSSCSILFLYCYLMQSSLGNGNIVLVAANGGIILNDGTEGNTNGKTVSANGSGNILIDARSAGSDLTVNAGIESATGHVTLKAADTVTIEDNVSISTATAGTISIDAQAGALSMAATSSATAWGSSLRLSGRTGVIVGNLTAADVSLVSATGAVASAEGRTKNVTATNLRIVADDAIGSSGSHLTTAAGKVTAYSAGTTSAGIYITEDDGVTVGSVSVTVTEFNGDGTPSTSVTDTAQADLISGSNGDIVLVSQGGSIVLDDGDTTNGYVLSAHGTGNVLVQANGAASDIAVNADIKSGTGAITISAGRSLTFAASADATTTSTGDINIEAQTGSIDQTDGSRFTTDFGNVRLLADVDINLASIETAGDVSLTATTGSILDNGNTDTDVIAYGLRLSAGTGIGVLGALPDGLETDVEAVSARATSGGINIIETDDIYVGDVTVSIEKVGITGATATITDAKQSDLRTTGGDGSIVLRSLGGYISLNDGTVLADGTAGTDNTAVSADGSGNVLISASQINQTIIAYADILSGTGHVTLLADGKAEFKANADIRTDGAGTIAIEVANGEIKQDAASLITTGSGNIRLAAKSTVTVGDIVTEGGVTVIAATGSITDADGTGDSDIDITAGGLILTAGTAVGAGTNHIETDVANLTAKSTSGATFLTEKNGITITNLSLTVEQAGEGGLTTATAADSQEDLTSGSHIVLQTVSGAITIDGGGDTAAVSAAGNILLAANETIEGTGTDADITIKGLVRTSGGSISVISADSIRQTFAANADASLAEDGDITITAGTGTIELYAADSITMADGTQTSTADGNIRYEAAAGSIAVSDILAESESGDQIIS